MVRTGSIDKQRCASALSAPKHELKLTLCQRSASIENLEEWRSVGSCDAEVVPAHSADFVAFLNEVNRVVEEGDHPMATFSNEHPARAALAVDARDRPG
jgi:hypothetical protein